MKKFLTRAITGGVYVALIITSLLIESPILFLALFSAFIIQGIWEFDSMTGKGKINPSLKVLDIFGGITMFYSFAIAVNYPELGLKMAIPYLAYIVVRNIIQLYIKSDNVLESWAYSMMSQVFVALPLSLINIIYTTINPLMLLAIFLFIWLNDTGAYCVGSLIGKHRLFERISPKKSWEGFWGGLILCIVTAFAIHTWGNDIFKGPNLYGWIGFSILVSILSTYGDLCESLIKRSLGVKDSGNILPGHGGVLDRIDSLLLVAPAALAFLLCIQ